MDVLATGHQIGGIALRDKYGRDYFKVLGRRGGRPRSESLAEKLARMPVIEKKEEKAEELTAARILVKAGRGTLEASPPELTR